MTKEGSVFQKPWKKYEKVDFSLHFSTRRAWDPSKKLDLAICYTGKKITALYDLIWPTWWPKKVPNLLQENTKKTRVYQTSIPYLPWLVRNHQRTNGKHHLPVFSIKIKTVPILPPISHLSGGTFPIHSLGTRTNGRPPYDEKSPPEIWDVVVTLGVSGFTLQIGLTLPIFPVVTPSPPQVVLHQRR